MNVSTLRDVSFDVHGIRIRLETDVLRVRDLVSTAYEAFVCAKAPAGIVVRLETTPRGLRLGDSLRRDQIVFRDEAEATARTLDRITEIIVSGLEAAGRLAIHGAALIHGSSAVIISGPTGSGKTTLALGLFQRGLPLLSDEMAVIAPDGDVLPYRRSLHIRPGTTQLLPDLDLLLRAVPFDSGAEQKWSLTPARLAEAWPDRPADASPLGHVLLLDDRPSPARSARLSPIPAAVAAVELCRAAPAAEHQLPSVLPRLARLVDGVRCARLEVGALPDSLDLVCRWLDGETTPEPNRSQARPAPFEIYRRRHERRWLRGIGGSMRPLLRDDDEILVEFGAKPRGAGDVVVFAQGGRVVAHRIVGVRDGGARVVTKGDATLRLDPPREATDILGVVCARRRDGRTRASSLALSGPTSRLIAGLSLVVGSSCHLGARIIRDRRTAWPFSPSDSV